MTKSKTTRKVPAIATIIMVVRQTQTATLKFLIIPMQTKQTIKKPDNRDLSNHPVRPLIKLTISQKNVILEQPQLINRLPGTDCRKDRIKSDKEMPQNNSDGNFQAAAQTLNWKNHVFTRELHVTDRRQLKHQTFHELPRLSGSNPPRYLEINTT